MTTESLTIAYRTNETIDAVVDSIVTPTIRNLMYQIKEGRKWVDVIPVTATVADKMRVNLAARNRVDGRHYRIIEVDANGKAIKK